MFFTTSNGSISVSSVCTAFNEQRVVGTKVTDHAGFLAALDEAITGQKAKGLPENGQMFVIMPNAIPHVEAGDAALADVGSFTALDWRGRILPFGVRSSVSRDRRAPKFLATVLYTKAAYTADPDVQKDLDAGKIVEIGDYVIVAVIATVAPQAPLGSYALVHNIGGGNAAFALTGDDARDAKQARDWVEKARAAERHEREWIVLAD